MPSLAELKARFQVRPDTTERSPVLAPAPPGGRTTIVKPEEMPPEYHVQAGKTIAEGAAMLLDGGKAIQRVHSGWWVSYLSREWSIVGEIRLALVEAARLNDIGAHYHMPTPDEVESAAFKMVAPTAKRIKDAGLARLFPAGRDAKDGSVDPLDSAMEDLATFDPDGEEAPATSRSPSGKPKVDVSKMKARAKAEVSKRPLPRGERRATEIGAKPHKSGHVPGYTLSIDGKDAILSFGRFKGQRLTDVVKVDKGYLEWMLRSPGDFARELLDVVQYVVNNPMAPRPAKMVPR